MVKQISPEAAAAIRKALDDACLDQTNGLPGVTFLVADKSGKQLFSHAAGKRGQGVDEALTLDNVFWIASFTKLITTIACMQLIEQGKLSLDDVGLVERIAPELKEVKVLKEDGSLVEKERGITLRMLLTHTAGFGYPFSSKALCDHARPVGYDEVSAHFSDFKQPLIHQPGERWEYSISIDWAGILVERVSGLSLNDYFHKYIFEPLGLKRISMFPTKEMKEKLMHLHARAPDGTLSSRDHAYHRPLIAEGEEVKSVFSSGGGGLFANPQDYLDILVTLLNDGTSPTTNAQILTPSTVAQMFTNQIPDSPNFARQGIKAAKPDLINSMPELYPIPDNGPQGWGLSFMITPSPTGRSANSGFWAGLPNLFWWCDRDHGITGIISTQVVPFGDLPLLGLWFNCETMVYNALK
ncbi:hypothetical protein AJ80_03551 [Polytolypa hystricis UAMH7299]|uniref:Beta-lactamase-related domain-containing protein n=1 Tax=Polytolypa hystricis (strain UAMH7299) TaxID=1447883 RepID=A0A2B7YFV6_POLH7|nr:hypothetical protein AJ80_03551 [Polytolypa hystricis UAMH7299]